MLIAGVRGTPEIQQQTIKMQCISDVSVSGVMLPNAIFCFLGFFFFKEMCGFYLKTFLADIVSELM